MKGNAVIGQSGGPTSVINQSLVGCVLELQKTGLVSKILGAKHGVRGAINNDYYDLTKAPAELLERVALTPAAALGSTRDKPDAAYCEKIFANFKQNNVKYFFYIGGNDSADTARIVCELANKAGHELHVFHIPKTIDNDLRVHDHTPGYGSAARFVAAAIRGDNYDNRSLPGIKIDIIMGRHAGFLTAASVLARRHPEDGPHLIYCPEAPLTREQFLADVDKVYTKHGRCLIAASEGVSSTDKDSKGHYITWAEKLQDALERDSHGNIQLSGSGSLGDALAGMITKNLQAPGGKKLRVRADTFGYLQRSFPGLAVSKTDAKEARMVGKKAVQYAEVAENLEGSVAMVRQPGKEYKIKTILTPLATVAREAKHMSPEFIENGNNISEAFINYVTPLVGPLPTVGGFEELKK